MTTPTLVTTPPERIHVLQLVGDGGIERAVLRLVERLPRERFRTSAVLPHECRFADQLRHLGADVAVMAMAGDPPWASIQGVAALVRHAGVDVLHAHGPQAHALAALAGHLTGRPVLATIHAQQLATMDVEAQRSAATHVSVACRHTYYHALAMGIDSRALSCIPNGIDARVFDPGAERAGARRRALGLDAGAPLVGFLGRPAPDEDLDPFVRVAQQVRRRVPDAQLVRIDEGGEGPTGDDLAALLHELDVVAATPSPAEAMPLVLMEAMACGVPVVAMRAGGVPDLVDHGYTGWLVGAGEFEGLAQRIAELLHDAGARRRMGENARERVLERFNVDDCVQRTGSLLTRLAARAARPRAGTPGGSPPTPDHRATRAG
jgi:glycosyltransferase involved in cell wall biosynthesis